MKKERGVRAVQAPSQDLVPPDGGWGWVIVLANCIISGVLQSLTCAFGIVYVHLVSSGYTNAQVVVIPAVFLGFTNLLGPLSTGLSEYYSTRRLSVIGVSLAAVGIFLCSLYNNLWWFYFCYGVLAGTGNALALHQGTLISQQYFWEKRVTANGMSLAGASLGFMLQPPLLAYLVDNYSSKGAFMLWSGILLHGLIGAALPQPVSWHLKPGKQTLQSSEAGSMDLNDSKSSNHLQDDQFTKCKSSEHYKSDKGDKETIQCHVKNSNEGLLSEIVKDGTKITESGTNHYSEIEEDKFIVSSYLEQKPNTPTTKRHANIQRSDIVSFEDLNAPNIPLEIPYIFCGLKLPRLTSLVKVSVLRHPVFMIMTFCSVCNRAAYSGYVTYVPSVGLEVGVEATWAPYLLTIIAIFELLARCFMSIISDQGWLERRVIYIIASFSSAMANFALTSAWNFTTLAVCCGWYGFSVGTCISLGPILLLEYIGLERFRCAFGLMLFMCGVFGLLLLPFTGWLIDVTGNYSSVYYVMGGLSLGPPILWSLLPFFYKHNADDKK